MLYEVIVQNRDLLMARGRVEVRQRVLPVTSDLELSHGVPLFLDRLSSLLLLGEKGSSETDSDALRRTATI